MKKLIVAAAIAAATIGLASATQAQPAPAPGYMIATYDIKDPAVFQQYMAAAGPLAPRYNGKVIVFNTATTGVEGHPRSVTAIAQFPSLADARRFYNSPEYAAARKLRLASTEGSVVIVEGLAPPR